MSRIDPAFIILMLMAFAGCVLAQSPGTFSATGNLLRPRFHHSATLLPSGKALIAGGNDVCYLGIPCLSINSPELYDPTTGIFAAASTITTVSPIGGISLPDGRVLFAVSYFTGIPASVEVYDPVAESFKLVGKAATLTVVWWVTPLSDGRVLFRGFAGNSEPHLKQGGRDLRPCRWYVLPDWRLAGDRGTRCCAR